MKRLLVLAAIILFSFQTSAQESTPSTNTQLSLNLIAPSLEWEVSLNQNSTIDLALGTAFAYAKSGSESAIGVFPDFSSQYRYYYNFEKRMEKGRKVSENSGNYIAGVAYIRGGNSFIGELNFKEDYAVLVGPAWGFQRVYNSGFKLNLHLGAGLGFNDLGDSYFTPFLGLQLGWLLAK